MYLSDADDADVDDDDADVAEGDEGAADGDDGADDDDADDDDHDDDDHDDDDSVDDDDDDDENARLWSLQYISDDPSFDNEAEINEMIPGQRGGWGVFMFRT